MLPSMGCAFLTSPMRTLSLTLLLIWVAISFPFVNGTLMSDAGNCSSNEFWYEPIQACIPLGEHLVQSVPPSGIACPQNGNWYWSNQLAVCLPASPESDVSSSGSLSCPAQHTWDAAASKCIQTGYARRSSSCGSTEFWFSEKATCLPRHNSVPSSARCPKGWYWSAQLNGCAPAYPSAIWSLACAKGTVWSPSTLTCQNVASLSRRALSGTPSRRPSPSMSARQSSRRRDLKSRVVEFGPMCPPGLDACPILKAGDWSAYECVDSKYDLEHCGGCSMDGRGEDCTSIKGVWNVECSQARCLVLTCRVGYIPSVDQRICVKL